MFLSYLILGFLAFVILCLGALLGSLVLRLVKRIIGKSE